jgi:hypothetical protein
LPLPFGNSSPAVPIGRLFARQPVFVTNMLMSFTSITPE